jgi:threonine dehydrogenase-like Zn-dependent dehydrogenase
VGLHSDGGFAEEVVAPEVNWLPLPEKVSLRHACLVEPLACVLHAVEVMEARADSRVAITGAGPSAFLFVEVLKATGVRPDRILVSGRRDRRLEIIRESGIRVVDVRSESLDAAIREHFGEAGPDLFVDQTGDPRVLAAALDQLARKGTLFIYDFMGSPILFDFGRLQLREIRILTSTGCPGTLEKAVDLIAHGRIAVEPLITHVHEGSDSLAAFNGAMEKDPAHVKSLIHFAGQ